MADEHAPTLPPLHDLIGKQCPDCGTGVVTITSYDADAGHETGENAQIVGDRASGGAFAWRCENCGHTGTVSAKDLGGWTPNEPDVPAGTQTETVNEPGTTGDESELQRKLDAAEAEVARLRGGDETGRPA